MLKVYEVYYAREYKRLFFSGFLHVDYWHMGFNMLTLFFFGKFLHREYGFFGSLFFYVVSIVISNAFTTWYYRNNTQYTAVGASGGVSAVLFASIVFNPNLSLYLFFIPIPIPAYLFAIVYMLYSLYGMRRNLGNVGHAAHISGAVCGGLIAFLS